MKLDLPRFYKACNPSRALVVGKPDDRKYYIDFSSVRGGNIIRELERTITLLAPEEATCQLFTGHIGCGKSTELMCLKNNLEQRGFHVVYFESSQDLDMADIDITDILLAIARQISASLEAIGIHLKPGYFTTLFTEVVDFLQTPIELGAVAELSIGIGKITAKTKESPKIRNQLRQYLEPRTNNILEAINNDLFGRAKEELKKRGQQGLVVLVDNLDRVDNTPRSSGRTQPEYLFVDRGEQLKSLNCHVIYTLPLVLVFSNDLGPLTNRFGVDPKVLPMVPVRLQDNNEHEAGMELLRQLVMARAFPELSPEERLGLITEVFDQPETLGRLCRVTGGHVRGLLMLLYRCLQRQDPPISQECLESVIKQRRNELTLAITADEWELLRQVSQQRSIRGEAAYQSLLRSLFVFEYRDAEECWFDLNPILADAKELQS
jgi:hypothetical protein